MSGLKKFDIVQISPESTVRNEFKGMLAIVSEPRAWGCIAYVQAFEGLAFIRLTHEQYAKVGALEWTPVESEG